MYVRLRKFLFACAKHNQIKTASRENHKTRLALPAKNTCTDPSNQPGCIVGIRQNKQNKQVLFHELHSPAFLCEASVLPDGVNFIMTTWWSTCAGVLLCQEPLNTWMLQRFFYILGLNKFLASRPIHWLAHCQKRLNLLEGPIQATLDLTLGSLKLLLTWFICGGTRRGLYLKLSDHPEGRERENAVVFSHEFGCPHFRPDLFRSISAYDKLIVPVGG